MHDDELLRSLIGRIEVAQRAFVGGSSSLYEELFEHSEDATLTEPFGGPAIKGWDAILPRMRRAASLFSAPAEASSIVVEASDVLQHVIITRLTELNRVWFKNRDDATDWNLRVTLVLRQSKDDWRILHRHADTLVQIDTTPFAR